MRAAPRRLLRWLAERGVTLAFLPTPLTDEILAEVELDVETLRGLELRSLTTGGDRLRRRPAAAAAFTLTNLYGPTEITVMATAGRVAPAEGGAVPSIGRPVHTSSLAIAR